MNSFNEEILIAEVREQDRLLPIANINRIMKRALPDNAKVSKEAKETIQACVSEFIGFITSEASDRLAQDRRKTITGDDIVCGMRSLGFDPYLPLLEVYLSKYRMTAKAIRSNSVKRSRQVVGRDGTLDSSKRQKIYWEQNEQESGEIGISISPSLSSSQC
eukprot:244676_1